MISSNFYDVIGPGQWIVKASREDVLCSWQLLFRKGKTGRSSQNSVSIPYGKILGFESVIKKHYGLGRGAFCN